MGKTFFKKKTIIFFILLTTLFSASLAKADDKKIEEASSTDATTTDPNLEAKNDLRNKISQKNAEIAAIEEEIKKYQSQIAKTGETAKTLQGAISTLTITKKKLIADISLTEKKIDSAELSIKSLGNEIADKQKAINISQNGIRTAIIQTFQNDQISPVESILKYDHLSEFWSNRTETLDLQHNLQSRVDTLLAIKQELNSDKEKTESKRKELSGLKSQLSDRKKIVEVNQNQTNQLLATTKNQEANYKKQLAEKEERRKAVEEELNDYESQLKILIDPNSYPTIGIKVLHPPLDEMVVTQQFGDTDFARSHAGVYNGKGHNGIDLKASPGTAVKAALAGIVEGTGNTDLVCPGASYGRWVLIKHGNGLSSIYAHLSLIKANEGDTVETGDLVGYSGNSGYTTGPHLHFGLFATQGIRIVNLKSKVCSGTYRVPVADFHAYLNPLLYL